MKTPEEIKKGLRYCTANEGGCDGCPYDDTNCIEIELDSLAYIEQLEETIMLMRVQMSGDCGVCRHKAETELCAGCVSKPDRPHWEYEGLPEVKGHEETD